MLQLNRAKFAPVEQNGLNPVTVENLPEITDVMRLPIIWYLTKSFALRVIFPEAGIQGPCTIFWIPACAGMTLKNVFEGQAFLFSIAVFDATGNQSTASIIGQPRNISEIIREVVDEYFR